MAVQEYERWVLKKSMHFGCVKESFLAGTEIQYIPEDRNMRINGRIYDNVTDFDILRRHGWVVPYDENEAEELKSTAKPLQQPNEKSKKHEKMKIIKSDEDEMESIDIRDTQIANRKKEAKEKEHKEAIEKMEIIKGDETPKERRDRIADEKKKMEIVEDDGSLSGDLIGKQTPLNAGMVKERTAEEVQKMREEATIKTAQKAVVEVADSNPDVLVDETTIVPVSPTVDERAEVTGTDASDDFEITRVPVVDDDIAKQINEGTV